MSKYTAEQVDRFAYVIDGNPEKLDGGEYYDEVAGAAECLRDYAALLREREAAKAGVTDDDVCDAMTIMFGNHWKPHTDEYARMRAALEAVAPMLEQGKQP